MLLTYQIPYWLIPSAATVYIYLWSNQLIYQFTEYLSRKYRIETQLIYIRDAECNR